MWSCGTKVGVCLRSYSEANVSVVVVSKDVLEGFRGGVVVVVVGVGADVKLDRKFRKRLQGREARVESGAQLVLGFESRSRQKQKNYQPYDD